MRARLQIVIIIFLFSLLICAFVTAQAKACIYYSVTVTQSANGWIDPGTTIFAEASTPSFSIGANYGYHITSITANGESVTVTSPSLQTYQFSSLSANCTLTATYAINTYMITVSQTANGNISPGTTTVNYGSDQRFAINPDSGYYISSITTDAGPIAVSSPSGQTVSFSNVQAAHTITATFEVKVTNDVKPTSPITVTPDPKTKDKSGNQTAIIAALIAVAAMILLVTATVIKRSRRKPSNNQKTP